MPPAHRFIPELAAAAMLACSCAALAGGSALPPPLEPFAATYRVSDGSARVGEAAIGLEPAAAGWRYYSRLEPEGLYALLADDVTDTTWLEPHGDGLRPLRFEHDGADAEDRITVEFDWQANKARVSGPGADGTRPLQPGMHDQFSAMLAVIQAMAADRERVELPSIDDGGEVEPLVFERAGPVSVTVPLGTYETVHVRRIRENSKRETDTWLAPELGWIPVRIDQRKKGELVARMELSGFNGRRAATSREETSR